MRAAELEQALKRQAVKTGAALKNSPNWTVATRYPGHKEGIRKIAPDHTQATTVEGFAFGGRTSTRVREVEEIGPVLNVFTLDVGEVGVEDGCPVSQEISISEGDARDGNFISVGSASLVCQDGKVYPHLGFSWRPTLKESENVLHASVDVKFDESGVAQTVVFGVDGRREWKVMRAGEIAGGWREMFAGEPMWVRMQEGISSDELDQIGVSFPQVVKRGKRGFLEGIEDFMVNGYRVNTATVNTNEVRFPNTVGLKKELTEGIEKK